MKRRVLGIYGALPCRFGGRTRPNWGNPPHCLGRVNIFRPRKKESRPEERLSIQSVRERDGLLTCFALLHEGVLGRARQRLAVGADRLGGAAVVHALLHERGLGRTRQRLAVLADRLGIAALLRKGRAAGKCDDQARQHDFSEHFVSPEMVCSGTI